MKPVALFDYQIKNSSKQGDCILDLFGGSGALEEAGFLVKQVIDLE
ncbi:DNA methyltransferase [Salmonella enterica]